MLAALLIVLAGALVVFLVVGGGQCLALVALEPIGFALPLLACAIFLAAPQMADMVVGMTGGYGVNGVYEVAWWHQLGLGCGVLALGFQGWFWSRAALNARRHWRDIDAPLGMSWQERWAPRLTLLPTTLIAVSPALMWLAGKLPTAGIPWLGVALAVLVSLGLIWLATLRRIQHEAHVRGVLNLAAQTGATVQPPSPLKGPRVKQLFEAAPWGPRIAWLLLLAGVIGCVIAQAAPDFVNDRLHTLTAALLALSCAVPIGTIALALCRDVVELLLYGLRRIIVWAMEQTHVPGTPPPSAIQGMTDWFGIALLIVLPIGASFVAQDFRLYDVLPAPNTAADLVTNRPKLVAERSALDDAVSQYNKCHAGETGKIPAIIVAAEGGASRSAVWTLSVMRMLDAETGGQFGGHLFAITSVSGGSLGAVTYALAQAKYLPDPQRAPTPAEQRKFWDKARNGLVELGRADLLSSGIARMFTSDLMFGVPSRGPALERAFEHHWRSSDGLALSKDDTDTGLLKLYASHPCLPHLLLNGTDVATGTRLITSTIRFELQPEPFPATADVLYGQQSDIKPAPAVLNSARFPLISPPGDLPRNAIDGKVPYQSHELTVIDGGVFENYGARTAWELVQALQVDPGAKRLEPIVVLVSNDFEDSPTTCRNYRDTLNLAQIKADEPQSGVRVPEFLTSLLGLYNTRGGHGRAEIGVLFEQLCHPPSPVGVFHFELPQPNVEQKQSAPMNWVLGPTSCRFMLHDARALGSNPQETEGLRVRLNAQVVPDWQQDAARDGTRCLPESGGTTQ